MFVGSVPCPSHSQQGSVVINNEYLSQRCDNVPTIVYMIGYSADHLSSVKTCQHHMRLRPYKNQFDQPGYDEIKFGWFTGSTVKAL
jgi:hypothetical protein